MRTRLRVLQTEDEQELVSVMVVQVEAGNGAREREMACAASVGVREYRSLRQAEPGLAMATAMAAGWNRGVWDSCACCGRFGTRSSIKSSLTEPT